MKAEGLPRGLLPRCPLSGFLPPLGSHVRSSTGPLRPPLPTTLAGQGHPPPPITNASPTNPTIATAAKGPRKSLFLEQGSPVTGVMDSSGDTPSEEEGCGHIGSLGLP